MAWGILGHVKERLTGAIILVALIVLLVPELLTGPIRTKSAPAAIPTGGSPPVARAGQAARPEPPVRSYTLTLGAPPPAYGAAPDPGSDDAPSPVPAAQAPAQPAKSPAQDAPAAAPQHAEAPGTSKPGTGGHQALQVAPPAAHPARGEAHAAASSGGWVVQLGSFASHRNADRLARSLQGRGFHMSVSPARAGSRVLWRVRAGPAHDRAGAEHLAARLRALGHRGELLPVR